MKLRTHTLSILFLFLSLTAISQDNNILLIIADDVGVGPIPNYLPSSTKANMPHLEALMTNGLTFDNVWSNPTCSPSRSCILTGKHGFRTNVLNPQELSTLSIDETSLHEYIDEVSDGTYASSLIGKWHLGGSSANNPIPEYPNELGIPYYAGLLGGGVTDYNAWQLVEDQTVSPSNEYITTKITDLAIDWINDQNQPWFCWVAYTAPHSPFHLPPTNMHTQGNLPTDQASIDANPLPYYLAMLESVDFEMGRILESIPADELAQTTILFIGDNGTPTDVVEAPFVSNRAKNSLYQGGVHVPVVASGAGVNRVNEREDALLSFTDFFTTIVELTGTPLTELNDSKSFAPLLAEEGEGARDCVYTEKSADANSSGWAARDATYKFIQFDNGNQRFYNLIADPYEEDNLLAGGGNLNATEQAAFDKLANVRNELMTPISALPTEKSYFTLSPNPADAFININLQKEQISTYQIIDSTGKEWLEGTLHQGQNSINIEQYPSGLYFLKVGNQVERFVVY